jgi:hypothetical protein
MLRRLALGGLGAAAVPFWVDDLTARALSQGETHAHAEAPGAAAAWTPKVLTPHQNDTVVTLTELILPQTDTPGAKAAKVNEFVDLVLDDVDQTTRGSFLRGLVWIDERSRELYGADVAAATPAQQTALLTALDRRPPSEEQVGVDFYRAIRSMTITGYYTSEIGAKQELGDNGNLFFADYLGGDAR